MLKINNISFSYRPDKVLIDNLSFTVDEGKVVALVGASGTGKSTLLKIIAGKLQAEKGEMYIDDKRLKGPKEQLIAAHEEVVMVSQLFENDSYFTVLENIENCLLHLVKSDRETEANKLIQLVDLQKVKHQKSGTLSGGEQQRLSLACALAKAPKVLLLDEPFSHLDVHLRRKVGRYIKELIKKTKMAVLLVTHEGSEALSWSSLIFYMEKGRIKRKYTPETAYYSPKTKNEGAFFGEINSVFVNNIQLLFRPSEFSLSDNRNYKIPVTFQLSEFRGPFYANYFKLSSGKEIVLYHENELSEIEHIYVGKD